MRPPFLRLAVLLAGVAFVVSCAGPSNPTVPSQETPLIAQDQPGGSVPDEAFPTGPVPGNTFAVPLPSDAPAAVRSLATLPSCGAQILFEQDVDISPIPTAPGPVTPAAANTQAADCLIAAWENGLAAEMDVFAVSDEADEIFSIYRLPGDGELTLMVRVFSHSDQTVIWTQTTCRQLSIQDGTPTPADCDAETPIP